ncbi:hypothetical protein P5673_028979 [Acropora cervicornis]|uniref:Uncharacterized protein n=1 Tax=Acropora cervicornis TaxID=6130 RepID=A0AAD9UUM4_ACRCE|nr:hypothetical protein P5673_028979 [Acropora cervicornis]
MCAISSNPSKPKKTLRNPGLKEGQPLPGNGTCKHYKKSYRWLRWTKIEIKIILSSKARTCPEMTTESINRLERQLHEKLKNNQNGRAKGSKWTAGVPPEGKCRHTKP